MSKNKKQVRAQFRASVFKRDRFTCQVCGRKSSPEKADEELDAHHITDRSLMPNGGYVAENGITVCEGGADSCHMQCERFHISGGTSWNEGLHPEDLYAKIGSSHEQAVRASERLG